MLNILLFYIRGHNDLKIPCAKRIGAFEGYGCSNNFNFRSVKSKILSYYYWYKSTLLAWGKMPPWGRLTPYQGASCPTYGASRPFLCDYFKHTLCQIRCVERDNTMSLYSSYTLQHPCKILGFLAE